MMASARLEHPAAMAEPAAPVLETQQALSDNDSLTVLHLSDLHFGQARRDGRIHFEQQKVAAELIKDAKQMARQLGAPAFVLITGDIAFSATGACHAAPNDAECHAYSWIQLSSHGLRWYARAYSENWKQFKAQSDLLEDGKAYQNLDLAMLPEPLQHWLTGNPVTPPPPSAVKLAGLGHYLKMTLEQHPSLPLIGVNPDLKLTLGIDDVYVPLRASVHRGIYHEEKWHTDQSQASPESWLEQTDIDLSQVFAHVKRRKKRGVVILGALGSGKTTLLKLLLVKCIRDGAASVGLPPEAVQVILPLRDLKADRTLDQFFTRSLLENTHLSLPPDFASSLRQSRPVVYLLEGLDEVSNDEERVQVSRWIQNALTTHTDALFAVTCRYAGYHGNVRFDNRFEELDIRPLVPPEAKSLLENFYHIVEKFQLADTRTAGVKAIEKSAHPWKMLESDQHRTRRMRELQSNPLLLTILGLVHQRFNTLPDERWRLYEWCLDSLLYHWQKAKDLKPPFEKLEHARRLLLPLAHWLHQSEGHRHATAEEVIAALEAPLASMNVSPHAIRQFLKHVRDRSGLMVGWGPESYGFIHLAFQEHLAAKHLQIISHGNLEALDQADRHFGESWWTEVILLLVSLPEPSLFEPFMRSVLRDDRFANLEHGTLLADCVADGAVKSALPFLEVAADPNRTGAVRYAVLSALRGIPEQDKPQVISVCRELVKAPQATLREMARELLAARGEKVIQRTNPNLEAGMPWVHQATRLEFVYVPPGRFMMGSKDGIDNVKPVHRVTFASGFWIGTYPVTNEHYGRFLAANEGHHKPLYWKDGQRNAPQQPVVGVNWHDPTLYCKWADHMLQSVDEELPPECQNIVLPSEAQWEYAARGPDTRLYPWGNGNRTPKLANFNYNIKRTTPVGQHPNGASWVGAPDMADNVWESCGDPWHNTYDEAPDHGSPWMKNPAVPSGFSEKDPLQIRVLRGGAFNDGADGVRSAYRAGGRAGDGSRDGGFRVLAAAFPSPS